MALIYCLRKYSYVLDLSLKVFLIFNKDFHFKETRLKE